MCGHGGLDFVDVEWILARTGYKKISGGIICIVTALAGSIVVIFISNV